MFLLEGPLKDALPTELLGNGLNEALMKIILPLLQNPRSILATFGQKISDISILRIAPEKQKERKKNEEAFFSRRMHTLAFWNISQAFYTYASSTWSLRQDAIFLSISPTASYSNAFKKRERQLEVIFV